MLSYNVSLSVRRPYCLKVFFIRNCIFYLSLFQLQFNNLEYWRRALEFIKGTNPKFLLILGKNTYNHQLYIKGKRQVQKQIVNMHFFKKAYKTELWKDFIHFLEYNGFWIILTSNFISLWNVFHTLRLLNSHIGFKTGNRAVLL